MSFDELFAKAMQILATFLLVNNKIRGKLVLSVLIMSDDTFKVTPVAFFTGDFNLFSWESDNLTFTL